MRGMKPKWMTLIRAAPIHFADKGQIRLRRIVPAFEGSSARSIERPSRGRMGESLFINPFSGALDSLPQKQNNDRNLDRIRDISRVPGDFYYSISVADWMTRGTRHDF
jgi:hypothetical protein